MMQSTGVILILFLSTLSLRRATRLCTILYSCPGNFYPRSPCGERLEEASGDTWVRDFYPRSPCGERPISQLQCVLGRKYFYPRSPCGERHNILGNLFYRRFYFYPRSPCGERLLRRSADCNCQNISIHALLAESDARRASRQQPAGISIHALLAESDINGIGLIVHIGGFLSTLSLRRATTTQRAG